MAQWRLQIPSGSPGLSSSMSSNHTASFSLLMTHHAQLKIDVFSAMLFSAYTLPAQLHIRTLYNTLVAGGRVYLIMNTVI